MHVYENMSKVKWLEIVIQMSSSHYFVILLSLNGVKQVHLDVLPRLEFADRVLIYDIVWSPLHTISQTTRMIHQCFTETYRNINPGLVRFLYHVVVCLHFLIVFFLFLCIFCSMWIKCIKYVFPGQFKCEINLSPGETSWEILDSTMVTHWEHSS